MRRGPASLAVVVFAALAAHGRPVCAQPSLDGAVRRDGPQFSNRVELVPLEVCVKNRDGQPTQGLGPTDFLVLEDNVLQRISFFFPERGTRLAVTLLVDASQSMKGERLERAKAAAAGFIDMLRADDLVEVMSFNERADLRYELGSDRRQAVAALQDIRAGGRTGLHEAVIAALGRFGRGAIHHANDRQVLMVLSDGEDTSSLPTFDDVLDIARRSRVLVYTVSLPGERGAALGSGWQLTRLAHDTGGRSVAAKTLAELVPLYQEIGSELIHLYRIGYVPAPARRVNGWRAISVRVPGKDVVVRTRTGYYATRTGQPAADAPDGSQRPKNPGMHVASHPAGSGSQGNGR